MEWEIRMTDVPDTNPDVTDLGRAVESIVQTILTAQINRIQVMLIECNASNAKECLHKVSSPPNPNDSGLEITSFPTPIKTNATIFLNQGKIDSSRPYDSLQNMDPEKTFEALAELGQLRQFSPELISGKKNLITKKEVENLLETKRQEEFCHTEKCMMLKLVIVALNTPHTINIMMIFCVTP
jgi:hypothetical protein